MDTVDGGLQFVRECRAPLAAATGIGRCDLAIIGQQRERALKEKTREAEILHRIADSISNTLDLEAVLSHIVEVVVEVTKADACLLYLLSEGHEELILRASKNRLSAVSRRKRRRSIHWLS